MIFPFWNRERREAQRAFLQAHRQSMVEGQIVYDEFKDQKFVIQEGEVPGFDFISAAPPLREAYEAYWQAMRDRGLEGSASLELFDRDLKK